MQKVGFTGEVADQPAGFGHQQRTGSDVPGLEVAFKKTIAVAGCDVSQVECGSAGAAHARALAHHFAEHVQISLELVAGAVGEAGGDQAVGEPDALGNAQAPVVEISTASARGSKQVIAGRVIDNRLLDATLDRQRNADAVNREAVNEVGGAVQRVDDPHEVGVFGAVLAARLFGQNAVARVGGQQRFDDGSFGGVVDLGDEIVGLLGRYANRLNVECSAVDDGTGRARSLDGHVEHGM